MVIFGERFREMRVLKELSQTDIEKRSGLKRCYISRVEHCQTVPCLETIEKLARALEVPTYRLFYDGAGIPPAVITNGNGNREREWGETGKDALYLHKLRTCLGQMTNEDRMLLRSVLQKMVGRRRSGNSKFTGNDENLNGS